MPPHQWALSGWARLSQFQGQSCSGWHGDVGGAAQAGRAALGAGHSERRLGNQRQQEIHTPPRQRIDHVETVIFRHTGLNETFLKLTSPISSHLENPEFHVPLPRPPLLDGTGQTAEDGPQAAFSCSSRVPLHLSRCFSKLSFIDSNPSVPSSVTPSTTRSSEEPSPPICPGRSQSASSPPSVPTPSARPDRSGAGGQRLGTQQLSGDPDSSLFTQAQGLHFTCSYPTTPHGAPQAQALLSPGAGTERLRRSPAATQPGAGGTGSGALGL